MLLDLSHSVENGLITYKGLPAPVVCDYLSREDSKAHYAHGTSFQIAKIEMVANTGTYIDSPFHRYEDGSDIADLDLSAIADVPGIVVAVEPGVRVIDKALFARHDVRDKAVLIRTSWSRYWRTERYFEGHPFLTESAASLLREGGARIVGIDSYNIDDIEDGRRPVHSILLGAGIPIVEHMCNLEQLPDTAFKLFAVPVKLSGVGTFPVRAFASCDSES